MATIKFYDYGVEDIITHRKRSTLRFGESRYKEGSVLDVRRNSGEFVGRIEIRRKTRVLFSQLTKRDAQIENWRSLSALKARLLHSYPGLRPGSVLTRYEFTYPADVPGQKKRGSNVDLTVHLPRKIVIVTNSKFKAQRYVQLLRGLPAAFSDVLVQRCRGEAEPRDEAAAESRALAKILNGGVSASDRFLFSTDDMGILDIEGRCIPVPNLGSIQNDFLRRVRGKAWLTIRTAIAISFRAWANSTVVYRSFYLDPAAARRRRGAQNASTLNSMLFLDRKTSRSVAEMPLMDPRLVQPLEKGIMDCLTGAAP